MGNCSQSIENSIENEENGIVEEERLKKIHKFISSITALDKQRKRNIGNGVLISKNIVLTTVQKLFDTTQGYQYDSLRVHFGSDGISPREYDVDGIKYLEQFNNCDEVDKNYYNFALLKLRKQVQYSSFLKVGLGCITCLSNSKKNPFQIFGTTMEPSKSSMKQPQLRLGKLGFVIKNKVGAVDPSRNIISYHVNGFQELTGCPLVVDNQIIAIHLQSVYQQHPQSTIGQKSQGSSQIGKSLNIGRLIDIPLLTKLQDWCKELNGHPFQIEEKDCCQHLQTIFKEYSRVFQQKKANSKLNQLKLFQKGLNSITLQQYTNLTILNLQFNNISTIDLTKNTSLVDLNISSNKIKTIDLANNINLVRLNLSDNRLSIINLSKNIQLSHLWASFNQITMIDITTNLNLTNLYLRDNRLSGINIEKNINLVDLYLSNNKLSAIDPTKNTNLAKLWLNNNRLQRIDVTCNTYLSELYIYENYLTTIDVTKNTKLAYLSLHTNDLTEISIKQNVNLTYFSIYNNSISEIDVTQNIHLKYLSLYNNHLSSVNISKNTKLQYLNVSNNQLSKMDTSNNENITELYLHNNQLSQFDASSNHKLILLWISNNNLTKLSIFFQSEYALDYYLLWFNLSHQLSQKCDIQLKYNSNSDDLKIKCNNIRQGWMRKKQQEENAQNKDECRYNFTASEL